MGTKTVTVIDGVGVEVIEATGKDGEGADTFTRWNIAPEAVGKQRAEFDAAASAAVRAKLTAMENSTKGN